MLRLSFKQVLAHRLRLALTFAAVGLGVAFVTGSLVLTDTSQQLFDDQFATATSGVDVTVTAAVAFDSAMGVQVDRDPVAATTLNRITAVPGVGSAEPVEDDRLHDCHLSWDVARESLWDPRCGPGSRLWSGPLCLGSAVLG